MMSENTSTSERLEELKKQIYLKLEVPEGEIETTGEETNELLEQAVDISVDAAERVLANESGEAEASEVRFNARVSLLKQLRKGRDKARRELRRRTDPEEQNYAAGRADAFSEAIRLLNEEAN